MTTQIILGWTLEQSSDWSATLQIIFYSGATYFNSFTGFGVTVTRATAGVYFALLHVSRLRS